MSKKRNNNRNRRYRKTAMRIAVFLDSIGVKPACNGNDWIEVFLSLTSQYKALPVELRGDARRQGRMLIRDIGLEVLASAIIPGPCPTPPKTAQALPKCPRCKSWGHKASWSSEKAVEEFCARSKDPGLLPYKCPFGYGWHAGHSRKKPVEAATAEAS